MYPLKSNLPASKAILLECDHLSYSIGFKKILQNISFSVFESGVCLLLGENGTGKSTLLKLIFNSRKNTTAFKASQKLKTGKIAYLGHEPGIYSTLTLRENVSYFSYLYNSTYKEEYLAELLEKFNLRIRLDDRVNTFSSGMKQKAGIICALSGNPDLILLDEPFTGLDKKSSDTLSDILKKQRKISSLIMSTHDPDSLSGICDSRFYLKNGELKID